MQDNKIYHSRGQALIGILLGLLFLGGSAYVGANSIALPFVVLHLKAFLAAIAGGLLGLLCLGFSASTLFKPTVFLEFSSEGMAINGKLILWKDIESIKLYEYTLSGSNTSSIGIRLVEGAPDKKTTLNAMEKLNRSLVDADITLEAATIDYSNSQLLTVIEEQRRQYTQKIF